MENQIQSFATFSETRKAAMDNKLREEITTKRNTEAQRFADLLAEYEVSTVAEIAEEQRTEFFAKLVGETEEVETEGNAFGAAVKKAKEEGEDEFTVGGETYKVKESLKEGRAFAAAVNRAREAGEETFEFNGKTYKVTKKINEAKVNPSGYVKAGKLGYNDQFLGKRSLSYTLSVELGMNPDHEFGGGNWLGFDHVSMYNSGGKKNGTILADALKGKYTYAELKSAAAKFLGIKESVVNEKAIEEADVKSAEDFKEYAFAVLKKVHGDDFDEAKAQEVVDGILDKCGDDYGACVGTLQASLS